MTNQPRLSVENLYKTYTATTVRWGRTRVVSELHALFDISFTVDPGEVVALLGPSGCGKTTLLRIIAGLTAATRGRAVLNGQPIVGPSKDKAVVFQHFGLLPWRNVLDNVAFPLELDGVPREERCEIAAKCIRLVGLAGFEHHFPHSLSGGMQQRVGIARALTREPTLLLMDEPFGALDAQTREILQQEVLRILEETKNTVLCVTHSIEEAVLLSNKIVVFTPHPGKVKAIIEVPRPMSGSALENRHLPIYQDLQVKLREMLRGDNNEG